MSLVTFELIESAERIGLVLAIGHEDDRAGDLFGNAVSKKKKQAVLCAQVLSHVKVHGAVES